MPSTKSKSYSTDPGWYTTLESLEGVPTDVLELVEHNALESYNRCGGHLMAARMKMVMANIDYALTLRGVR